MTTQAKGARVSIAVAGVAGIGFASIILLVNVAFFVPAGLPAPGAEPGDAALFFAENRSAIDWATVFLPVAWFLGVVFAAGAVAANRSSNTPGTELWSLVGFAGVVSQNLTIAAVSSIRLALVTTSPASTDMVAALWALHDSLFLLNGTFLALALLGFSIGAVQAGVIPRWHAVIGFVAAALQFASATLTPVLVDDGTLGVIGLAGWLLWVAWLVIYGATLINRARTADQGDPNVGANRSAIRSDAR